MILFFGMFGVWGLFLTILIGLAIGYTLLALFRILKSNLSSGDKLLWFLAGILFPPLGGIVFLLNEKKLNSN